MKYMVMSKYACTKYAKTFFHFFKASSTHNTDSEEDSGWLFEEGCGGMAGIDHFCFAYCSSLF